MAVGSRFNLRLEIGMGAVGFILPEFWFEAQPTFIFAIQTFNYCPRPRPLSRDILRRGDEDAIFRQADGRNGATPILR
jgi:hypothetical protein